MINTCQQQPEKPESQQDGDENKDDADLSQDALQNFSLALQIIEDATGGNHATERLLYLEIDTRLRMAELGKHVCDLKLAQEVFTDVIKLCQQYPDKNEQTLTSAIFALGKL